MYYFGIFDLVAKAPILNMIQLNGENGCPTCLHPGVWDSSRYYLPDTKYPTRINSSVVQAASDAEKDGKVVLGIKGKSVLQVSLILLMMYLLITCTACWMGLWNGLWSAGVVLIMGAHTILKDISRKLTSPAPTTSTS